LGSDGGKSEAVLGLWRIGYLHSKEASKIRPLSLKPIIGLLNKMKNQNLFDSKDRYSNS